MKKIISLLMAAMLIFAMCISASAEMYEAREATIYVDGKEYKILGYENPTSQNCVKIRDIAMMLNGTSKQFNVTFENGVVNIIPGQPYTPIGAELQKYTGTEPVGAYSSHTFTTNGSYNGIEAVLAADYNYVPFEGFIYDITDFGVIYNEDGSVEFSTTEDLSLTYGVG